MAKLAARRSTQLVVIGVAVFAMGAALVFLSTARRPSAPAATAPLVADGPSTSVAPVRVSATVSVPAGKIAIAVDLPAASGLDGWAKPGDRIDVFALVRGGPPTGGLTPPYSRLVLPAVPVLDTKTGSGDGASFLLAVTPHDAETLTFYARFESLWAALADPANTDPVTRGASYKIGAGR